VQQNAGAAEEMATAAQELAAQAEQLQETVAFFRLDGTDQEAVKRLGVRQSTVA